MKQLRNRHWAFRTGLLLILLVVLAAGAIFSLQQGGDWVDRQTNRILADMFRAPVGVRESQFSMTKEGLLFTAEGIHARPFRGEGSVSIQHASLVLRIIPLLSGQIRTRKVVIRGLELSIPAQLLPHPLASSRSRKLDWEALKQSWLAMESPSHLPTSLSEVQLVDAKIVITQLAAGVQKPAVPLLAVGVKEATFKRHLLRHTASFSFDGKVQGPNSEAGTIAISVHGITRRWLRGTLDCDQFHLPALAPVIEASRVLSPEILDRVPKIVTGRISFEMHARRWGRVRLDLTGAPGYFPIPSKLQEMELVADAFRLRSEITLRAPRARSTKANPTLDSELSLVLTRPSLVARSPGKEPGALLEVDRIATSGHLQISQNQVHIENGTFEIGGRNFAVFGTLTLPLGRNSPTHLTVSLDELERAQILEACRKLPMWLQKRLAPGLDRIESGTLRDVELHYAGTLAGLERSLNEEKLPSLISLRATLTDGTLRLGKNDRVEALHAKIHFRGDSLQIQDASGMRAGAKLPTLDFSLAGLDPFWKADARYRVPPASVAPIPGILPLLQILFPGRKEGRPLGKPTHIHIDWIDSSITLWPIRNVDTVIVPDDQGFHFSDSSVNWGGVAIRGSGVWKGGSDPRLSLDFQAKNVVADFSPSSHGETWIRGRWRIEDSFYGPWPYRNNHGTFRGKGSRAEVEQEIAIAPTGVLRATGELALDQPDSVGVRAHIRLEAGDLESLAQALTHRKSRISGTLAATMDAKGKLVPGESVLRFVDASGEMEALDGTVQTHLPLLLAIAKASRNFNPFGSREVIRYDKVRGDIRAHFGELQFGSVALTGPDLRLLLSGKLNLLDADAEDLDVLVGVLLFGTVDKVISKIPIIQRILLGKDKNLIGTYFKITGSRNIPDAHLVPTKLLVFGPAQFAFKELPNFVSRNILGIGGGEDESDEQPTEAEPQKEQSSAPSTSENE